MVDIGFRRGSSSASHRVLEAHPLNPIGWVAPTVDPATGADKPRRLAQLPLNGASDDAITIEQWLSARGGSGGRGASVSPANGSHNPESAQSQSVTPRRLGFARVHSATDGVMFQGGSSRRRSMVGIDVSDPSETSAGGPGRAAGCPAGTSTATSTLSRGASSTCYQRRAGALVGCASFTSRRLVYRATASRPTLLLQRVEAPTRGGAEQAGGAVCGTSYALMRMHAS